MLKIQPYSDLFSRLNNAEHYDVHDAMMAYIEPNVPQVTGLAPFWTDYQIKFRTEGANYKISQKIPGTEQVEMLDKQRDRSTTYLHQTIIYRTISKVEAEQQAANRLKEVFDKYRNASQRAYNQNSAMITNLIEDLREDEYAADVATLNIAADINQLERENEAFKVAFRERSKVKFDDPDEKLKDARLATDKAFGEVADCINGLYIAALVSNPLGDAKILLEDLVKTINSYILTADEIFRRRVPSYRRGSKKEDTPDPKPPTPEDEVPHLSVTNQRTFEKGPIYDDSALKMSFEMVDQSAFQSILADKAVGAIIRITDQYGDADFPISAILMDEGETVPIGLIADHPDENEWFIMPFRAYNDVIIPGRVMKDGVEIAILDDFYQPALISFG